MAALQGLRSRDSAERRGPWVMQQRWHHLLFAHWRVPVETIARRLPPGMDVDVYDGSAWVSVIPFYMTGVRFRAMPPIPTAHAFAELNVRTYVRCNGQPGIWFFSLDAASTLAVIGARLGAALPYYPAKMRVEFGSPAIDYYCQRLGVTGAPAVFDATYQLTGPQILSADPGSLDFFLTERYCLFSSDGRRIWRVDVEHPRWTLSAAHVVFRRNTMLEAAGINDAFGDPLLSAATFQDVRFWPPARVR